MKVQMGKPKTDGEKGGADFWSSKIRQREIEKWEEMVEHWLGKFVWLFILKQKTYLKKEKKEKEKQRVCLFVFGWNGREKAKRKRLDFYLRLWGVMDFVYEMKLKGRPRCFAFCIDFMKLSNGGPTTKGGNSRTMAVEKVYVAFEYSRPVLVIWLVSELHSWKFYYVGGHNSFLPKTWWPPYNTLDTFFFLFFS